MKLIFGAPVFFLVIFFSSNSSAGIEFDDVNYDWNSGSCRTSPDGSSVSCGGQSGSCRTSPDGSDVSCGGQSGSSRTSSDGSKRSRGGWYNNLN